LAPTVHEPTDPRRRRSQDRICEAWLEYVASRQDRRPSTVKDYRSLPSLRIGRHIRFTRTDARGMAAGTGGVTE